MKLFLLCGKAKSGKGVASAFIKEYLESQNKKVCEIQVMRTIKGYAKDYFGWDGSEETKPRKLLQELGYDIIREEMHLDNFHLNRLSEDISILSRYFDYFIVNDIRLPYEIEYLKEKFDTTSIGLIKEDYVSPLDEKEEKHITEHALDNYDNYDYKIISKDEIELKNKLSVILEREVI